MNSKKKKIKRGKRAYRPAAAGTRQDRALQPPYVPSTEHVVSAQCRAQQTTSADDLGLETGTQTCVRPPTLSSNNRRKLRPGGMGQRQSTEVHPVVRRLREVLALHAAEGGPEFCAALAPERSAALLCNAAAAVALANRQPPPPGHTLAEPEEVAVPREWLGQEATSPCPPAIRSVKSSKRCSKQTSTWKKKAGGCGRKWIIFPNIFKKTCMHVMHACDACMHGHFLAREEEKDGSQKIPVCMHQRKRRRRSKRKMEEEKRRRMERRIERRLEEKEKEEP